VRGCQRRAHEVSSQVVVEEGPLVGVPGPVLMRNCSSRMRDSMVRRDAVYAERASFRGMERQVLGLAVDRGVVRGYRARISSKMEDMAGRWVVSVVAG